MFYQGFKTAKNNRIHSTVYRASLQASKNKLLGKQLTYSIVLACLETLVKHLKILKHYVKVAEVPVQVIIDTGLSVNIL